MSYARQQEKIDAAQLDNRVLGLLVRHSEAKWKFWTIAGYLGLSEEDVLDSLRRLFYKGLVTHSNHSWSRTTEGDRAFQEVQRRPALPLSPQEFKNEALTGMDARGNQSSLTRAALHGRETRRYSDSETVARCSYVGEIKTIAKQFDITSAEALDLLLSGEIHVCECGDPHWGRFHRHGGKGGAWQSKCIECRKKERNAKQKKNR